MSDNGVNMETAFTCFAYPEVYTAHMQVREVNCLSRHCQINAAIFTSTFIKLSVVLAMVSSRPTTFGISTILGVSAFQGGCQRRGMGDVVSQRPLLLYALQHYSRACSLHSNQ